MKRQKYVLKTWPGLVKRVVLKIEELCYWPAVFLISYKKKVDSVSDQKHTLTCVMISDLVLPSRLHLRRPKGR